MCGMSAQGVSGALGHGDSGLSGVVVKTVEEEREFGVFHRLVWWFHAGWSLWCWSAGVERICKGLGCVERLGYWSRSGCESGWASAGRPGRAMGGVDVVRFRFSGVVGRMQCLWRWGCIVLSLTWRSPSKGCQGSSVGFGGGWCMGGGSVGNGGGV